MGKVNLITLSDPGLPQPPTPVWAMRHLHLAFHDIDEPVPGFVEPTAEHAQQLIRFYDECHGDPNLLVSCTAASGRSPAVVAAFAVANGVHPSVNADLRTVFATGTYNRLLYRLILEACGESVPAEPLVSIVCRMKWPADRAAAFIHCMRRQRWKSWELILVSDGPLGGSYSGSLLELQDDRRRVRVVETKEKLGRWGHPYRQLGIDLCKGQYIGLNNDDNYLVPGYIDQLVFALEDADADLAICNYLGHYMGWKVVDSRPTRYHCDLGAWLARASLVAATPWVGVEFDSDGAYIQDLAAGARRVVKVQQPLFVHN